MSEIDVDAIEARYRPREVYDQTGRDIMALIARVRWLELGERERERRLRERAEKAEAHVAELEMSPTHPRLPYSMRGPEWYAANDPEDEHG